MAATSSTRVVKPWGDGTGYPLELFTQQVQDKLLEQKSLFCARKECGGQGRSRRVLRDPYQAACGHRLCKECVEIIRLRPASEHLCDACEQEKFDDNTVHARSRRRQDVRAPFPGTYALMQDPIRYEHDDDFSDSDSDEEGMDARQYAEEEEENTRGYCKLDLTTISEDKAAFRDVQKLQTNCPFKCDTNERLLIKTLERHMEQCQHRKEACIRCTEPVPYTTMEDHLQNRCILRPVECPNNCGKRGLKARDLQKHKSECPRKPPLCRICKQEYDEDIHDHIKNNCTAKCPLGCSVPAGRVIEHLSDPKLMNRHLYKMLDLIVETEDALSKSQAAGTQRPGSVSTEMVTTLNTRLIQVETKTDHTTNELERRLGSLSQQAAKMLLENVKGAAGNSQKLKELDGLFRVFASDVNKQALESLQNFSDAFNLMTERINKAEAESKERMIKLEMESQIRNAQIEDQKTSLGNFIKTSFNGCLLWKIDEVSRRRNESHIKHSFYSHAFFTETYGYKMCARIYFNGDGNGKNTHVSMFFVVMKGEYDALLPWPFQQKVTMKLKNQKKIKPDIIEKFRPEPSSASFQRPKNEMNIASGCPQFAEQSVVFGENNGYVVNDTMFIEIRVDPAYNALHDLNPSKEDPGVRTGSSSGGGKWP